jgi:pimeloyl-ACP methyl ester carboxylesterase
MMMIKLAQAPGALGDPVMSDADRAVFAAAFAQNGFSGSINWYRNMDRNWHILADVQPIIRKPALMIYGEQDMIPKSETLSVVVPGVDVVSLNCGHWIQQELPEETTKAILDWLAGQ